MSTRVVIEFDNQADAQRFVNWVDRNGEVSWDVWGYEFEHDHGDVQLVESLCGVLPVKSETPEEAKRRVLRERRESARARARAELKAYVESRTT